MSADERKSSVPDPDPLLVELRGLSAHAKVELRNLVAQPLQIIQGAAFILANSHKGDPEVENRTAQITNAVTRLSQELRLALEGKL